MTLFGDKAEMQNDCAIGNNPKVIVCTPEPRDGAAKYAAELVIALARAGCNVVLLCPANFAYSESILQANGELVYSPERDVSSASLLRRILRNLRFMASAARTQYDVTRPGDIVHFQNPLHLPLGFIFYRLVRLRGASIILTAHDPLPHRWRFPKFLQGMERRMLGWAYQSADAIVVHNASGKRVLLDLFHVPRDRVHTIPHGADPDNQRESKYPEFDCLRLLAFGGIRENKGLHYAIEAVQKLRGQLSIPVRLTISGKLYTAAETQYWKRCMQMIENDPEGIEVSEGFVADADIPSLFARHHALILPYSDFFSESGVAALAVSHRRPILATTAGGLGEMIDQFECGIGISTADVTGVMAAIRIAAEAGHERLRQMGETGERKLCAARSWNTVAKRTIDLYSHIHHGPGRTAVSGLDSRPAIGQDR
jgi:glycosyltransferase involved in cell wall biosynthesis